jgi:phage shock protein PspC (stress-responsive transcriptional regulator)
MQNQKLYRTRDERMLAGVCGGLAQFFSIDPPSCALSLLSWPLWAVPAC